VKRPEIRIERIWEKLFPERTAKELQRMALSWELATHPAWPMPGCRRLLAALRRRRTVLGIVSNAQFYTPILFEALLGAKPEGLGFSQSLCIYSFEHSAAKPELSLFRLAAERLADMGIRPEDTLIVGNDPLNDIVPATQCGMMTALFGGDGRSTGLRTAEAAGIHPDVVIGALGDLPALLHCIEERIAFPPPPTAGSDASMPTSIIAELTRASERSRKSPRSSRRTICAAAEK
jgi:putative hydrolase of the HAD superfamily